MKCKNAIFVDDAWLCNILTDIHEWDQPVCWEDGDHTFPSLVEACPMWDVVAGSACNVCGHSWLWRNKETHEVYCEKCNEILTKDQYCERDEHNVST